MKKLIAKLCIWILGKLGYDNDYHEKNTIVISIDADAAINDMDRLIKATKKLQYELDSLKPQKSNGL